MENSNTGKIIGALLFGVAVGGVLGILFAPHKGSKTRRKLSAKGADFTESMKEKFNTLMDEVKKEAEVISEKANDILENKTV